VKRIFLFVVVAALTVGAGIVLWIQFSNSGAPVSQGWDAAAKLSSEEQSFAVDRTGGIFAIELENGDAASLKFPAGASTSTTVAATAISELSNLPEGVTFISGVSFGPEGTAFAQSATLEFPLPQEGSTPSTLYAFRFVGTGQEFQLYPLRANNGRAVIPLTGFSGYGLLHLEIDAKDMPVPTGIGALAKHNVAVILNEDLFRDEVTAEVTAAIAEVMADWYDTEVAPNLKAALVDDALTTAAISNWLDWLGIAQVTGVDEELSETKDAEALAKQVLANAIEQTAQRCETSRDPDEGVRLMQLAALAELLGFAGDDALQNALNTASVCLQFRLEFESTMFDLDGEINATGSSVLSIDPTTFQLAGSGVIEEDREFVWNGSECFVSPEPSYSFKILPVDLSTAVGDSSASSLELVLVIGDNLDVTWECDNGVSTYTGPFNRWQELFFETHAEEEIPYEIAGDFFNYLITDWDFSSAEQNVVATKVYEHTVEGITETTVFKLLRGAN
jgi:hypothetical protein